MSNELNIELFGEDNIDFLAETMCLDLEEIQSHIDKVSSKHRDYFRDIFDFMVSEYNYFNCKYSNTILIYQMFISDKLNSKFLKINIKHKIQENSESYNIGDVLRHFFLHFCEGGVRQAYKYRETDYWYPKIIFRERIESDIDDLDKELVVYRGTSKEEYKARVYGQSWTLDKTVAYKFAFSHYSHSLEYIETERVILKAIISRENILLYEKYDQHKEQEVIVRTCELKNVVLLEEKILESSLA
ncbi:MAG TPA: hypothetical protein EYP80_01810 [Candidatus Aenigmarchaeota archaeon]|nr:hypothetical protein [Candidatus Aenigmarchaeota archaeon]